MAVLSFLADFIKDHRDALRLQTLSQMHEMIADEGAVVRLAKLENVPRG